MAWKRDKKIARHRSNYLKSWSTNFEKYIKSILLSVLITYLQKKQKQNKS